MNFFNTAPIADDERSFLDFSCLLVLAAISYNAILSVINAHVFSISTSYVMVAEILIVGIAFAYVGINFKRYESIRLPTAYLFLSVFIFLFVSIAQEQIYLKSIRDVLIIVAFFMIGALTSEKNMMRMVIVASALVLSFIIVDAFFTPLYVSLFEPSLYFVNTRGILGEETDETGIFRNALGYEGRFSFNIADHRVSSIFLEQVSAANFSMILMIFLSSFWNSVPKVARLLFFATIIMTILTSDTRMGMGMVRIVFIGHFIFPYLPRYANLLYMPILIIFSFLVFYDPLNTGQMTDDLPGRVGRTTMLLSNMDLEFFTGSKISYIERTADSGYAYYIATQTLFGLLALWLFIAFTNRYDSIAARRFLHGVSLYIFINLLFGGSILSIKTSALLWMIAGFLYYRASGKNTIRQT